jgi:glycine betaine/proline transport system substrate-binding protein
MLKVDGRAASEWAYPLGLVMLGQATKQREFRRVSMTPTQLRRAASGPFGGRAMLAMLAALMALAAVPTVAATADPPQCRKVRIADIGWTAETAAATVLSYVLRDLGYAPEMTVLSIPVSYESLKSGHMDLFLGGWMPAQKVMLKPYADEGSIDLVRVNLVGAKYTMVVPDYLYDAGLRDFADINRFRKELNASIYGIEPGNDGNGFILDIIRKNEFGLGGFKLIESSEQGMLAEVERAVRVKRPIVFLGWSPHPMNARFNMRYLTGGDASFGPDYGAATVSTLTRAGYARECPNMGRLLRNLEFNVDDETAWMQSILGDGKSPSEVAAAWVPANPDKVNRWLTGVTRFDGSPLGVPASGAQEGERHRPLSAFESWVTTHKIPIGAAVTRFVDYAKTHARGLFDGVAAIITGSTTAIDRLLNLPPPPALIAAIALFAFWLRRSWPLALFIVAALLFIMNQGYWDATIETLTLVLTAALIATLIGIPLGIAAARHPRLYSAMRPVLDLMQTLPTFVYLTPTLVLFGLGVVPGLISTVIFALPAPIRLTHLGISSVPKTLLEAGQAFGASPLQLLLKVELPSAASTIMAGVTQCIMLSLSMVVIAALVGAGGLGVPVVRALNTVQVGMGFEAGIAIVLLAIILDRISRPADKAGDK